jgi:hypothetical protein
MNAFVELIRSNPDQERWRDFDRNDYPSLAEGFRTMGAKYGTAPTDATSDADIRRINYEVRTDFTRVAEERNEEIPEDCMLYIVFCYLGRYETTPFPSADRNEDILEKLDYETTAYRRDGIVGTYDPNLWKNMRHCGRTIQEIVDGESGID